MKIETLGKITDKVFAKIQPKHPDVDPDTLRSLIHKKVKKKNIKLSKSQEQSLNEGLVGNVKPRRNPFYTTPVVTALGISKLMLEETHIQ